jgi:HK97 family phage major capsid protein
MLTDEQIIKRWDTLDAELKAELTKSGRSLEQIIGRLTAVEQVLAARRQEGGGGSAPDSWGRAMIDSPEFKALASSGRGTARISVKTTILHGATSGGPLAPVDQRLDPILMPRRRLGIRDLLSQGQTTSNAIRYVQQTGRDVAAGVQTESFAKREAAITFELKTANVATIAVWIPASKQILDDAPALMATIDSELRYGVAYAEEAQILGGDGLGENLRGLITAATPFNALFVPSAQQRLDVILLAQAQLEAVDFEATGVVMNPVDWAKIRSTKDGEDRYIAGGPLTGAPRQLWDLPVVTSNSLDQDEFLVADFKRAALVLDRQEIMVEISTEHSDFFTRNLVAIRAEKRLGLIIQQPGAVIHGEFSTAT